MRGNRRNYDPDIAASGSVPAHATCTKLWRGQPALGVSAVPRVDNRYTYTQAYGRLGA